MAQNRGGQGLGKKPRSEGITLWAVMQFLYLVAILPASVYYVGGWVGSVLDSEILGYVIGLVITMPLFKLIWDRRIIERRNFENAATIKRHLS